MAITGGILDMPSHFQTRIIKSKGFRTDSAFQRLTEAFCQNFRATFVVDRQAMNFCQLVAVGLELELWFHMVLVLTRAGHER